MTALSAFAFTLASECLCPRHCDQFYEALLGHKCNGLLAPGIACFLSRQDGIFEQNGGTRSINLEAFSGAVGTDNLVWGLTIANKIATRTQSISSSVLLGERDKGNRREDYATCHVILSSRKLQTPQAGAREHCCMKGIINRDAARNNI
jgi:hypothetical protein